MLTRRETILTSMAAIGWSEVRVSGAAAEQASPIKAGLQQALELWKRRGHEPAGQKNVADFIAAVSALMRANRPTPVELFFLLSALSGAHLFLGNVSANANSQISNFETGGRFAERILKDVYRLTLPLGGLPAIASGLKQSLDAEQLAGAGTGLFLAAANWIGWCKASNSLTHISESRSYLDLCKAIGQDALFHYSPAACRAAIDSEVPTLLGGNARGARAAFQAIVASTRAANLACSVNGLTNYYYARNLVDAADAAAKPLIDAYVNGGTDFYPPDIKPENLFYRVKLIELRRGAS